MKISRYRTALMGFATLWIWYFHCGTMLFENSDGLIHGIAWYIKRNGFCGVDIFMLLSGIGLYYHFKKKEIHGVKDYFAYIKKRLYRIYCVFLPVTIIIAYAQNWTFRTFVGNITTYNNFRYNIYSYLWYIAAIIALYIIAPFYFFIFNKRKHYITFTSIVILLEVASLFVFKKYLREDLSALFNRVPVFTLGFCVGRLEYEDAWKKPAAYVIAAISTIGGVIYTYCLNTDRIASFIPAQNALANIFVAFGIVLLLPVLFYLLDKLMAGRGIVRVICFFGTISLEMYCYQEFIESKVSMHYVSFKGDFVCFAITFAMSCITYFAIKLFSRQKKQTN